MPVQSLRLRLLLVGPLRLALGAVWLVAGRAAGVRSGDAALLLFLAGAFGAAFLIWNDPRARFRSTSVEVAALPGDARVEPAWRHLLSASFPSTIGVSVLAAVTLVFEPALAVLLGGILAGLGIAALLHVREVDAGLYVDPRMRAVFRR